MGMKTASAKNKIEGTSKSGSRFINNGTGDFFSPTHTDKEPFFNGTPIQAKLEDPELDTSLEQEADQAANGVLHNSERAGSPSEINSEVKQISTIQKNIIQLQHRGGSQTGVSARRAAQLREMARDPGNFITVWLSPRTTEDHHSIIIEAMDGYYGEAFTNEFVRLAEANQLSTGGFVTSHRNTAEHGMLTPERLASRGYALAQLADRVLVQRSEVWIHPSGHTITIGASRDEQEGEGTEATPALAPPEEIDLAGNPESRYGPRVATASQEVIGRAFPCLSASLFANGNIECYDEDGGITTLIPQGAGRNPTTYAGYNENGNFYMIWTDENNLEGIIRGTDSN